MGLRTKVLMVGAALLLLAPAASAIARTGSSPISFQGNANAGDAGKPQVRDLPPPRASNLDARLLASADVDVGSPFAAAVAQAALQAAAGCQPVAHLQRHWYGAQVADTRVQDVQLLAPRAVVGQVEALVPTGVLGLLEPALTTVHAAVDVAVAARWDEDLLHWGQYTDDLYVGLPDATAPALPQVSPWQVDGWDLAGIEMSCDGSASGVTLVPDARTDQAEYTCLGCTALPADGWLVSDILEVAVHLAKAGDYRQLAATGVAVSACPDDVQQAIQSKIDELGPSYADSLRQQVERHLAGLRP